MATHLNARRLEVIVARAANEIAAIVDDDQVTFSIPEFCERNGLSKSSFYRMPVEDRPKVIVTGPRRKRITRRHEREWQESR